MSLSPLPPRTFDEQSGSSYAPGDRAALVEIAKQSVVGKLRGEPLQLNDPETLTPALREHRATFVTLRRGIDLRGCCGSLRPREPLGHNVARSALSAAFGDRRFQPVEEHEVAELDLHISILTVPAPIPVLTEADLLLQLRPGIDGLILTEESRQAVFLPSVWEQVSGPREFLQRLKQKAGFDAAYWSPWIKAELFTAASVHGSFAELLPSAPAS